MPKAGSEPFFAFITAIQRSTFDFSAHTAQASGLSHPHGCIFERSGRSATAIRPKGRAHFLSNLSRYQHRHSEALSATNLVALSGGPYPSRSVDTAFVYYRLRRTNVLLPPIMIPAMSQKEDEVE